MDRIRREKMNILRKAFKIFDGSSWNEYHLKTDSKQVIHTKADGTDTTVEEQLLALNSTLKSAIEYVDYPVTLDSNAYVAPFSYYANNYLPISDIKKYGIPISITAVEPNGQPSPISITPSTNGNYRYTIAATAGKVVVTVAYLKF